MEKSVESERAFDMYEDQMEELKNLVLEARMRGGPGSMSAMVREAIHEYIANIRAKR